MKYKFSHTLLLSLCIFLVFLSQAQKLPENRRINSRQISPTTSTNVPVAAILSRQDIEYSPNRVVGVIALTTTVPWPSVLNLTNINVTPSYQILNTQMSYLNPLTGNIVSTCSSVLGSNCSQIFTIRVFTSNTNVCNFDGVYVFTFIARCRSNTTCPPTPQTAQISAVVNTQNFCPTINATFPIGGQIQTYKAGYSTRATNFVITTLPLLTGDRLCINATVQSLNNATKVQILNAYFTTLYLTDSFENVYILLTQPNPVICPYNLGACGASGANVMIDTINNPNAVLNSTNQAGACFYITVSSPGSSPQGIANNMNFFTPWQVVASVGVSFSSSGRKKESLDSSNIPLFAVFNVSLDESLVQLPGTSDSNGGYRVLCGFPLILFAILFCAQFTI